MDGSSDRELEQAAIRLLATREHTRVELGRKLAGRAEDKVLLEQVLDGLEASHYLSDARFAEQYIESRSRKGYGPLRIRKELQEKGVSSENIAQWLDEYDVQWEGRMKTISARKFGQTPPADFKQRAKRARFLEYRGFHPEMIRSFLWDDG